MMAATKRVAAEREKCDAAARGFYRAGVKYIAALDEFIGARKATRDRELASSRERVRLMETFLHRLFSDEFATRAAPQSRRPNSEDATGLSRWRFTMAASLAAWLFGG